RTSPPPTDRFTGVCTCKFIHCQKRNTFGLVGLRSALAVSIQAATHRNSPDMGGLDQVRLSRHPHATPTSAARHRAGVTAAVAMAAVTLGLPAAVPASAAPPPQKPAAGGVQPGDLAGLSWRNIGPQRGGRSIAAAGSDARPNEYWFGATGG